MVKSDRGLRGSPKSKARNMRTDAQGTSRRNGPATLDPRIQNEIGKHLRAIYNDVINEPVPDKFMELLERLEQSTERKR
jgi:hypothetical protein